MMGFGMVGMLLFWGVLVALLIGSGSVVAWLAGDHRLVAGQRHVTPRQILDERLARGEIDQDQYEALRAKIG